MHILSYPHPSVRVMNNLLAKPELDCIPKIIPKKKKAPFNVEAFAKECNAYVVKQERQEEQENLQH